MPSLWTLAHYLKRLSAGALQLVLAWDFASDLLRTSLLSCTLLLLRR